MENTRTINKDKLISTLKNLSFRYLARYSSSSKNLKKHLLKKLNTYYKDNPDSILFEESVNTVIQYLERLGYLNDKNYAKNQLYSLINKGKPIYHIEYTLQHKGITKEDTNQTVALVNKEDADMFSALRFIKRKRLGCYRTKEYDEKTKEKEYGSMYRNGFSFDIIEKTLRLSLEEYEELYEELHKIIDL